MRERETGAYLLYIFLEHDFLNVMVMNLSLKKISYFRFLSISVFMIGMVCCSQAMANVSRMSTPAKAQERAAGKRDYLVLCYGEWDKFSNGIYKNIWRSANELNKHMEGGTVITEAVYMQSPTDADKKRMQKQNEGFKDLPRCLPSVYMYDADGFLYAVLAGGELPGGPDQFAQALAEVQKKRIERDELIKKGKSARDEERANFFRQAGDIQGIRISPKLLALAKEYFPGNKYGLIDRFSFDIFNLHHIYEKPLEEGIKEIDKYVNNDKTYSQEQRQTVLGLKASFLRKKGGKDEDIKACYEQMVKINPETFMGKAGKGALDSYYGVEEQDDGGPSDEYIGQNLDDE